MRGKVLIYQTVTRLHPKQKTARNPNRCTPVYVMPPDLHPKLNQFKWLGGYFY